MADAHQHLDMLLKQGGPSDGEPGRNHVHPSEYSDESLALRFTARCAQDWRYVENWHRWLTWDGKR